MESFQTLKRRTTDLVSSIPSNAPSMPNVQLPSMPNVQLPAMPEFSLPSMPKIGGKHQLKGTWQHVPLPPLPRSSHSIDVVAGNAYIFGGEIEPRKPVDNEMHVVRLPSSGAPADYYTVKPRAAGSTTSPSKPETISEDDETPAAATPEDDDEEEEDEDEDEEEEEDSEEDEDEEEESEEDDSDEDDSDEDEGKDKLEDVSLASPTTIKPSSVPATASVAKGKGKEVVDKGKAPAVVPPADVPCSRVGHATAVIGSRIFLFGGRNSNAQTLDEKGRVWVFSTRTNTWSHLDPHSSSPIPPARSYFAAVATDKPRDFASTLKPLRKRSQSWKQWAEGDSAEVGIPQAPIVGHVAEHSTDEEEDGYGTFIIHGGCLADGGRTNDVWAFDVHGATWKELPSAPGPARGGPALAIVHHRLYRFGGYDGQGQQGGQLDVLELNLDESHAAADIGISALPSGWQSTIFPTITRTTTNDVGESTAVTTATADFPGSRSVACMNLVTGGGGREYLILMLGERDASSLGHAGAGKFWNDAWAFQVPPLAGTAASLTSKIWSLTSRLGGGGGHSDPVQSPTGQAPPSDGAWSPVSMGSFDPEDLPADARGPGPRGWLDSASMGDVEENGIVLFGGLSEGNSRLGDMWIFRLE
ncbi:uncharacterized protein B0I36DRAFT_329994 [Microdochium trichocladiopsis]|uniref:Kelch domain-containing protein n=1 Tax=Microdochium trichocladiopsis TaxID=1682393 RepID=A0A9P8Y0B0_9PEZI|nr:uncharacterized protein B0I36DRAFT_329994 [Microdochium trichocladiopsis]KAH7026151.1 hypothetical protein B0I36DRAFT_329994 [Microdochium trichocladiopsis]